MVVEIGITEVIELTGLAVMLGLGFGYMAFIRPKNQAMKKELEYESTPRNVVQVPMGELPVGTVITDSELESLKEDKSSG